MLNCLYWTAALFGGSFLFFVYIMGELGDFFGDLFEESSPAIEELLESAAEVVVDHEVDFDLGHHDYGTENLPKVFSLRTLIMFTTGFGIGGLIGNVLNLSDFFNLLFALGFGVSLGTIAYLILYWFYTSQGSTDIDSQDYIGLSGLVITTIPKEGLGRVNLIVKLHRKNLAAKSEDGSMIPYNTRVFVTEKEGETLIVREEK